jgi:Flp pilus assembly protein TadB
LDGSSTLWQKVDKRDYRQVDTEAAREADKRLDAIQKKLDHMFDKLDTLETSRGESNHLEIILFVLGGIFLILLLDLLVKQGTQATMMIAAAGGSMLNKRYMIR